MSKCEIVRDLLPIYVDGETSPGTTGFIKEHLSSCAECRNIYRNDYRIPHALEDKFSRGSYNFSSLMNKITSNNLKKTALLAVAAVSVGCVAGYLIRSSEK